MQSRSTTSPYRQIATLSTRQVLHVLRRALMRQKSRRSLAMLDDRLLDDIGLTDRMATLEASKPIWKE